MNDYLSFEEVAGELRCNLKRVRSLVIESKTLKATRITKNGLILESSGLDGHFPYDLDFCCHLDDEGGITSDLYESNAVGKTVLTRTFDVGFLRVERSDLEKFITEHPNVLHALAHAAPVVPESQAMTPSPAPVMPAGASDGTPAPERRLARLRELGGNAKYSRYVWQFTGIKKLVESEKSEGRNRNDEKTIRADLREAAQAEHDAKRVGFGSGLGQR